MLRICAFRLPWPVSVPIALLVAVPLAVAGPVAMAPAMAGVTAVRVPADPLPAAYGAGNGPVVTDNYRRRARSAAAGARTGTAAWAGGGRLASRRARCGPAGRVPRPRRWWRAGHLLDRRDTHGNGQHHTDEPRNRHAGKDQGWPATKPASAGPRTGHGPGRGRALPLGVICDSGLGYQRRSRRNRRRSGQGTGHGARADAEIVPQTAPQPACLPRDLGRAARPPGRILGDKPHHQGAHLGRHRPGQRRHRVVAVRARHVRRLAHEGRRPGQAFVSDDPQRVQITGRPGPGPGNPLRRQVLRRPRHDAGDRAGRRAYGAAQIALVSCTTGKAPPRPAETRPGL
jgi:hypothetical protein